MIFGGGVWGVVGAVVGAVVGGMVAGVVGTTGAGDRLTFRSN